MCKTAQMYKCRNAKLHKCTVGAGRNLPLTVYDGIRPPHHRPPDNKPTKRNFYVRFNAFPDQRENIFKKNETFV